MLTSLQQKYGYSKLIQPLGCAKPYFDWESFAVRVILTFVVISFLSIFIFKLRREDGRYVECLETLEDAHNIFTCGTK